MCELGVIVEEAKEFILVDGVLEFLTASELGSTGVTALDGREFLEAAFPDRAYRVRETQSKAALLEAVCEANDPIVGRTRWLGDDDERRVSGGLNGHALRARQLLVSRSDR